MTADAHPVTAAGLKAVAAFRKLFEHGSAGEWAAEQRSLPVFDYGEHVRNLRRVLQAHGFVFSFDWPGWREDAQRYLTDPTLIQSASLEDVRRLFTTIVRADRFCEGSLASDIDSGFVLALLRRVEVLAEVRK
ncbi:MAG: DUF6508 domain-containing protein [Polyangiaceae bacterium]